MAQNRFAQSLARSPFGDIELLGLKFKNPIGIAAGFDKNGAVTSQLAALGFGHVEVGTTTYRAQDGNVKPRLFRLPDDEALVNRAGFNNEGTQKVVAKLKKNRPNCILGMNIGKNKDVPNERAIENYLASFDLVHEIADYIVINVSSPNTPNLRELQQSDILRELLSKLQTRNIELAAHKNLKKVPLLVKIAPDLSEAEVESIVEIALELNLDGIVATNTTISRENLHTTTGEITKVGNGGLSGKPLREKSTAIIKNIYRQSKGKLVIIGVGGIFTAQDAFDKLAAGASLVQVYTGFVYQGFTLARDVNDGLQSIYNERGFGSYHEMIGCDNKI